MSWSDNLYLRWAATAVVALLAVLIVSRLLSREQPSDPAALLASTAGDAALQDSAALPEQFEPTVEHQTPAATAEPAGADAAGGESIAVDVIGAVGSPGVYRLTRAARVDDAV